MELPPKDIAQGKSRGSSEPAGCGCPGVWQAGQGVRQSHGHLCEQAVEWLLGGTLDAMTTCPINKQAMNEAGYPFAGHTELLAHLAVVLCCNDVCKLEMEGRAGDIHVALQEVPR